MKVKELMELLPIHLETNEDTVEQTITGVYCGDLLSWVMSHAKEGNVWLTIQGHMNTVAVASLLGLAAIIIVEESEVEKGVVQKANEEGIAIFTTKKSSYEIACLCAKADIGC